jgi:hypothetical protein
VDRGVRQYTSCGQGVKCLQEPAEGSGNRFKGKRGLRHASAQGSKRSPTAPLGVRIDGGLVAWCHLHRVRLDVRGMS